ncbi:MAG: ergothioneine biosynthesis protein EgtB [Isosphaeraceae bacterium]
MSTTPTADHARPAAKGPEPAALLARYRDVRATTERLCAPLATEDYVPQSMPDASPVKWHLAHTSWFFETFLLKPSRPDGEGVSPGGYAYLFNSYYNALGERIARPNRGLLTRPTVAEVYHYRETVDERMAALVEEGPGDWESFAALVELGIHHEQQHQELILTDLKHLFSANPLRPAYREETPRSDPGTASVRWEKHPGGLVEVGFAGGGFAFDNEGPRHKVYLEPFRLASRLATCGEYLAFMDDGGYDRPEFWLSDGWAARQARGWTAPLYWERETGAGWTIFTLSGARELIDSEPVSHISFYEADAFARWAGARLPTEHEWEVAASGAPVLGNFLESEQYHPRPLPPGAPAEGPAPLQVFGDVWEWTRSPYSPYPGYAPAAGALGEYNGKFMCNQMVLRGGSCATPRSHIRPTYRNFFPPDARWQFSGLRLAQDA